MSDKNEGITLEDRKQNLYTTRTLVTGKISDIVRFIGLGLVAIFYTIRSSPDADTYGAADKYILYVFGVFGVIAIVLDYLQYVANHYAIEEALLSKDKRFNDQGRPYRIAELAFKSKQIFTFGGALALVILVLRT